MMTRVMCRMLQAQLGAGWSRWLEVVRSQHWLEEMQDSAAGTMRRAMLRMLHAQLAAMFVEWRQEVRRQVQLEELLSLQVGMF